MARLSVNVDHVATVRQARRERDPDPVTAAILIEAAGADGVIVHLREDRRHIQDRDVELLREIVTTKLDLEMAATEEMVKCALSIKPDLVTLVPERRQEITTEGGLDVVSRKEELKTVIKTLQGGRIPVSLFVDPDLGQIRAAHHISADLVEIHTGRYSNATNIKERKKELEGVRTAARLAKKLGMGVNAGHGLTYRNVREIAEIREIEELCIGHSIISRSIFVGLEQAVREMRSLVHPQTVI